MKCQFSKADIIKMSRVIDEHLFVMFGGRGFQQTRHSYGSTLCSSSVLS